MTDDSWYDDDDEANRMVPMYVLVNGRTTPRTSGLDLATQVIALPADTFMLEPEYIRILDRCGDWISIAEIAAYLDRPLTLTKVLVDVLLERRFLALGQPAQHTIGDRLLLETLLEGLHKL
jgi:hypothetical protein